MDLLPAAVDVTKNVSRMKRENQERQQAEAGAENYDQPKRRLVRLADLLVAFPVQEQQRNTEEPGEQFSGRARMRLRTL